jgi:hypothetical protein
VLLFPGFKTEEGFLTDDCDTNWAADALEGDLGLPNPAIFSAVDLSSVRRGYAMPKTFLWGKLEAEMLQAAPSYCTQWNSSWRTKTGVQNP